MNLKTNLKICSLNCQGLGEFKKRRDVINYLREYDILCLQDTHFSLDLHRQIRNEWGHEVEFSSKNSRSRGVAISISNGREFKVNAIEKDSEGNFIMIDITLEQTRLTLASIYAPNSDSPLFFKMIKNQVLKFGNMNIIMVGDWNLLAYPEIDGYNYKHINNPKARDVYLDNMVELDLHDIWREDNTGIRKYTWFRKIS